MSQLKKMQGEAGAGLLWSNLREEVWIFRFSRRDRVSWVDAAAVSGVVGIFVWDA
jgi:hypothetical protein